MKYCLKCLQPDTRPGSIWLSYASCPACDYHDSLNDIHWPERLDILGTVIAKYTRASHVDRGFDCIIGVSGGKDSTRQALFVRDKLGLNPLLVCLSYPPSQVTNLGCNNLSNLIELGFDIEIIGPSPVVWKKLIKAAFFNFANWAKATEMALFSAVPIIAIRYNIPLIIWGENPGLHIGDSGMLGNTGWDGNAMIGMNTLSGGDISWMLEEGVEYNQLNFFKYPTKAEFKSSNINIIYLGWFMGDWDFLTNGRTSLSYGLTPRIDDPSLTGDPSGVSSLDEDWVIFNQMIKYYKYGFGKTTEFVNEQIRIGTMSRLEAIGIVREFDGKCDAKFIDSFCKYIEIQSSEFWSVVDANVNKALFSKGDGIGVYIPKFKIGVGLNG